jgi:hypothetical protein
VAERDDTVIPANLLPEAYQKSYCVAGGWAACPALAQDMDVWVYGIETSELETVRCELIAHLSAENAKVPYYRRPFYVEQQTEARNTDAREEYESKTVEIRKVAKVEVKLSPRARRKVIHLLVTDARNPAEILDGFDVSTHAVAIDYSGAVWKGIGFTAPHIPPVALLMNEKTPARMRKIALRFGHDTGLMEDANIG